MDATINELKQWIDASLGALARSREGSREERKRAFLDGSIDALLSLRNQLGRREPLAPEAAEDAGATSRQDAPSRKPKRTIPAEMNASDAHLLLRRQS